MRIIFSGTPKFALPAFNALLNSQHEICAVYTQPDRPAGRGLKLAASPIKEAAQRVGLPVYQPESLLDSGAQQELKILGADIFIDVAYGLLLPEVVLATPHFGCINIHPSLLPRWRGAAPIQHTILAGDEMTGVTIMKMDKGLDTGAIYKQESFAVAPDDTTTTLEPRLAELGAKLLLMVLEELQTGTSKPPIPQDETKTCYATKISKKEAQIDWQKSAAEIDRMIRAFDPWPIAYTQIDDQTVRIFKAMLLPFVAAKDPAAPPGTILQSNEHGIDVATGTSVLRLLAIQLPGGKVLPVKEILKAKSELFAVGKKYHHNSGLGTVEKCSAG